MPFGIREYTPPPAKVQSHITNIVSCIHSNEVDKISEIIEEWRSDSSIPNPTSSDLDLALVTATKSDNIPAVVALLDAGTEISPMAASNVRSGEMFYCILSHGWDVNSIGQSDMPVLRHHVSDYPILQYLLENCANPNFTSPNTGLTLLDIAAANAPLKNIELMFNCGADVHRSSALQSAAGAFPDPIPTDEEPEPEEVPAEERPETNDDEMDRIPVMKLLLERGADINAIERMHAGPEVVAKVTALGPRGRSGTVLGTALHCAVRLGAVERVKWLMKKGANPEVQDTVGKTVIQVAEQLGNRPLCIAALSGSQDRRDLS